jgi:hypothetical protein
MKSIGSGSGFEYFEPRLARLRLRLEVFEPMLFISNNNNNKLLEIYLLCERVYLFEKCSIHNIRLY